MRTYENVDVKDTMYKYVIMTIYVHIYTEIERWVIACGWMDGWIDWMDDRTDQWMDGKLHDILNEIGMHLSATSSCPSPIFFLQIFLPSRLDILLPFPEKKDPIWLGLFR
jgi:hypothetical protein